MVIDVTDPRSSPSDQIAHAAKVLGRSNDRTMVFQAIYFGKKRIKTVEEIHRFTGLPRKRVLEEGKRLFKNHVVKQTRKDGDTAYEKDSFYDAHKKKILSLSKDRKKLSKFPTKVTPKPLSSSGIVIKIPHKLIRARMITIDDIDSFSKVRSLNNVEHKPAPLLEAKFKFGIKKILNENGDFKDWGGERNDLLTTRLLIKKKRRIAAFAFKGRGTRGKLTPASMGKNADQIQRLFTSPAEIFIIQYWGQIDESVIYQMGEFAKAKSVSEGKEICYGIIDGQDSNRVIKAYPRAFKT